MGVKDDNAPPAPAVPAAVPRRLPARLRKKASAACAQIPAPPQSCLEYGGLSGCRGAGFTEAGSGVLTEPFIPSDLYIILPAPGPCGIACFRLAQVVAVHISSSPVGAGVLGVYGALRFLPTEGAALLL